MTLKTKNISFRFLTCFVLLAFILSSIFPNPSFAQTLLNLPTPGVMVTPTPAFVPAILKGVKIYPDNPLRFDFILDTGDSKVAGEELKEESRKLIKYFLASLTVPEDDLWVNLSPYEKERIIPEKFGTTEMGRDLLAQDYLLKQLTASLIYPEEGLGKEFWDKVYKKAYELYGTTNIPINTFNKVWIVPDKAVVYESKDTAFIVESHLKVMLEGDYLALSKNLNKEDIGTDKLSDNQVKELSDTSSQIVKDVILPAIEKEINEGQNFALLRQVYHSLILAIWYKKNLKESILNKVYVDKNKIKGVDVEDKDIRQKIYDQYIAAYEKGVYDYIKQDDDPYLNKTIQRRYVSGGADLAEAYKIYEGRSFNARDLADIAEKSEGRFQNVAIAIEPDQAEIEKKQSQNVARPFFLDKLDSATQKRVKLLSAVSRLYNFVHLFVSMYEDSKEDQGTHAEAIGFLIDQHLLTKREFEVILNKSKDALFRALVINRAIEAKLITDKKEIASYLKETEKTVGHYEYEAGLRAAIRAGAITEKEELDTYLIPVEAMLNAIKMPIRLEKAHSRDKNLMGYTDVLAEAMKAGIIANINEVETYLQKIENLSLNYFTKMEGYAILVSKAIESNILTEKEKVEMYLKKMEENSNRDGYKTIVIAEMNSKIISQESEVDEYLKRLRQFDGEIDYYKREAAIRTAAIKNQIIKDKKRIEDIFLRDCKTMELWTEYRDIVNTMIESKIVTKVEEIDPYFETISMSFGGDQYKTLRISVITSAIQAGVITKEEEIDRYLQKIARTEGEILNRVDIISAGIKANLIKESRIKENLNTLKSYDLWEGYTKVLKAAVESDALKGDLDVYLQPLMEHGLAYPTLLKVIINSHLPGNEDLFFEQSDPQAKDHSFPTSLMVTVKNLQLILGLTETDGLYKQTVDVLNEVRRKNQIAEREDQKIDVEIFETYLLRGFANAFAISERMANQILDIYLHQRGYLPLVSEVFELFASLSVEDVAIFKEFYEMTGNQFVNRPNDLISLAGYAKAYQAVGLSQEEFRDDLMIKTDDSMEIIQERLGKRVIQKIADQLGIQVDLTKGVGISRDILKEWNLKYLGLFVSAQTQWGEKEREFFRLLFRATLEGKTAVLLSPPDYKNSPADTFGEGNNDLVRKVQRYNLNFLKVMESLGLRIQPLINPNNAVQPVVIGGIGAQRRPIDILRDFRKRLEVFQNWLLGQPERKEQWSELSKSIGNEWAKIKENPSAVLLTDPNKRKSLKRLKRFVEEELHNQNNHEAIIGIAQILDEIKYYKVTAQDSKERSYRIRFWRREVGRDAVLGNCAGSCTSLGSNATAIFQFLLDQGTNYAVIEDLAGDVKGYARFFLALDKAKHPIIFIDSVDGVVAFNHKDQLIAHIVELAKVIGLNEENVKDRESDIVEAKIGGIFTDNYFNHSGAALSVWEEDESIDGWEPKAGWDKAKVETAMEGSTVPKVAKPADTGGIDFNPSNFNLETKGSGVDIPTFTFDPAQLEQMNIDGFYPVIYNIVPVTNLPMLLGVAEEKEDTPTGEAQDKKEAPEISYDKSLAIKESESELAGLR